MGVKIQYVIQREDGLDAPWGAVLLGTGELDDTGVEDPNGFWILRQVPDQLRVLADQLESGMTTGPDAQSWLEGGPNA